VKANRYSVLLPLVPLLVTSWLAIALVDPANGEQLAIGAIIGTIFAQTTLASAWTALGPGPLVWRMPLALAWCAMLIAALGFNIHGPPEDVIVMMAVCVAVQWLLVQVPLWWLAVGYGLRLRHRSEPGDGIRPLRFGIRQLMLLTAIVAVMLGAGRGLAAILANDLGNSGEAMIFAFLAYAGVLMMLPLLLAALLPRYAVWGILTMLALIAGATWAELPLLEQITQGGGGPDLWHFVWINFFQSAWIVFCIALLRGFGYGVEPPRGALLPADCVEPAAGESPFGSMP
jgi:hypothetical protein